MRTHRPLVASLFLLAAACGPGGLKEDPILRLSAVEALAEGKALLADGKYGPSRPYLLHAFETSPNSAEGREALLLVADSYFEQGGEHNYVQAESKYRDFLNRFPTSDRAAYVQFRIALSLARRLEKPDRDQSGTRKALEEIELFLRLYPDSSFAEEARAERVVIRANLAEHEFHVGYFYFRYGLHKAAAERFEYLLDRYPDYPEGDKVYFFLGQAYRKADDLEKSAENFERLRSEYPESPYLDQLPKGNVG